MLSKWHNVRRFWQNTLSDQAANDQLSPSTGPHIYLWLSVVVYVYLYSSVNR